MRRRAIYNEWVVHAPLWRFLPSSTKWYGIFGSAFYVTGKGERIMFSYPETAEHFYFLKENHIWSFSDILFATYSIEEMRAFIKHLTWTEDNKKRLIYVYDAPTKTIYRGEDFVKTFID